MGTYPRLFRPKINRKRRVEGGRNVEILFDWPEDYKFDFVRIYVLRIGKNGYKDL